MQGQVGTAREGLMKGHKLTSEDGARRRLSIRRGGVSGRPPYLDLDLDPDPAGPRKVKMQATRKRHFPQHERVGGWS